MTVLSAPFPVATVADALRPGDLDAVAAAVEALDMERKHTDLMRLHQSQALSTRRATGATGPLAAFRQWLGATLRPWLAAVTGIPLTERVDIFGARYSAGDFLLCHDDELEGRRIAYILYLVPEDWAAGDGGALDLFAVDAAGQPTTVAASVVPVRGTLAFFDVSEVSFHQVAEVLRGHRFSLTGWFHGPRLARRPPPAEPCPPLAPFGPAVDGGDAAPTAEESEEAIVDAWCQWVNEDYLQGMAMLLHGRYGWLTVKLPAVARPSPRRHQHWRGYRGGIDHLPAKLSQAGAA